MKLPLILILLIISSNGLLANKSISIRSGIIISNNESPNINNNLGNYYGVSFVNKDNVTEPYFYGISVEYGHDKSDYPSSYKLNYGSIDGIIGYEIFNFNRIELDFKINLGVLTFISNFDKDEFIVENVSFPKIDNNQLNVSFKASPSFNITYSIKKELSISLQVGVNFALTDNINPWLDGTNDSYWNCGLRASYVINKKVFDSNSFEGITSK
ncbi:hypothetical protein OAQ99_00850 [Candidatus Kapabacteria bacterium]|nr:hypothetical protein [Candidatus Kapabacteria bacterium]